MENLCKLIQNQFDKMCKTGRLFRCNVEGELLWLAYMEGFGPNDPVWRSTESSVHNCNYCHGFIKRYGNVVSINPKTLEIMSLFDLDDNEVPEEYKNSLKEMTSLIHKSTVSEIFVETYTFLAMYKTPYEINPRRDQSEFKLGVQKNTKRYTQEDVDRWPQAPFKVNDTYTYHHMFITIPKQFIDFSGKSKDQLMATPRQLKDVFKRGLNEISKDTMQLVIDLEAQGSLLNGASYIKNVKKALKYAEEYENIPTEKKESWLWLKSLEWGPACAFRNTAIGTLLVELTEGKEINEACKAFNKMVDPANYMKASAPITQKQIKAAEEFVEQNGYADSFDRRCATIEDIDVNEILFANADANEVKTKISIFDNLKPTATTRHKRSEFDKVEEVSIEKFMKDILPGCTQVELFLTNKNKNNFMTLLTSKNKDSKRIFKWDNNFSWTYVGNLAGKSMIKQAVKAAGGFVDAPFRCSMIWNETGDANSTDLDLHCKELDTLDHIYYGSHNIGRNMRRIGQCMSKGGGVIDIDITRPKEHCEYSNGVAVENIFYPDLSKVKVGRYEFFIHNFNGGGNNGARAEIFINGETYKYEIRQEIRGNNDAHLATVHVKSNGVIEVEQGKYFVGSDETPETVYGLDTCKFHKVSLICPSPNFWTNEIGNKHYFFMLQGATAPESIRSIHNEYLKSDLLDHRKVMEVLGSRLKVESTPKQLSGLGFNATVRDEVILRLSGSFKRVIKVKF